MGSKIIYFCDRCKNEVKKIYCIKFFENDLTRAKYEVCADCLNRVEKFLKTTNKEI